MKYRTFHDGLLAYYDQEPKCLPKFGGLVRISATSCRKIGGTESLEEIRNTVLIMVSESYYHQLLVSLIGMMVGYQRSRYEDTHQ